ncbi:hypothetical protein ACFFGH_21900 [Lysobacter korlensis]|uniref:Uncharacterized protein n=1 Tax=Lysobacter korlensis TaxID=553636 RepID=A0ABV6RU36_9GAMM
MEIVLVVLAGWLVASLAVALLVGRVLRVADRRERATLVTADGMPRPTRETAAGAGTADVQETA